MGPTSKSAHVHRSSMPVAVEECRSRCRAPSTGRSGHLLRSRRLQAVLNRACCAFRAQPDCALPRLASPLPSSRCPRPCSQVLTSDVSAKAAAGCMNRLAKLSARFIGNRGFSIGIDDVTPKEHLRVKKQVGHAPPAARQLAPAGQAAARASSRGCADPRAQPGPPLQPPACTVAWRRRS